jgi:hypothetical protein
MDAMAGSGAKPNIAMLDVATPVALNFKKFLRDTRIDMGLLQAQLSRITLSSYGSCDSFPKKFRKPTNGYKSAQVLISL